MKLMFVGALLMLSIGCSKETMKPEEQPMEALETPESIEQHILRCEYGDDCMYIQ